MKIVRVDFEENEMFIISEYDKSEYGYIYSYILLRIIIKEKWDFFFTNVRYDFITGTMKNMQRSEGLEERRSRGM